MHPTQPSETRKEPFYCKTMLENFLGEFSQMLAFKSAQFPETALFDLLHPMRIGQESPSDRNQIKVPTFIASQKFIQRHWRRTFAAEGPDEFTRESDGADSDRGFACELLRPAGEIQIR